MTTRPKRCRGIIVTTDGRRIMGPWRGEIYSAMRAAQTLADRRQLSVKQIDGLVRKNLSEEAREIEIEIAI